MAVYQRAQSQLKSSQWPKLEQFEQHNKTVLDYTVLDYNRNYIQYQWVHTDINKWDNIERGGSNFTVEKTDKHYLKVIKAYINSHKSCW